MFIEKLVLVVVLALVFAMAGIKVGAAKGPLTSREAVCWAVGGATTWITILLVTLAILSRG